MNTRKCAAVLLFAAIAFSGCGSAQKKEGDTSEKVNPALVGTLVDHKVYYDDGSLLGTGKALYKSVMSKPVRIKQGPWVQYYKGTNTIKQAEGEYKDDKQTGEWKFYFKDGKLQQEGSFSEGIAYGEWKIYYPTSEMNWKASYSIVTEIDAVSGDAKKIGRVEGVKTTYYKSGKVWKEETLHGGKKNGRCQEYYEAGNPKEIAMYQDDLKNGALNEWWPSGKPKTQGFFVIADQIDRKTKKSTGEKIESKTGNWKMFYSNGQTAIEGSFSNNMPQGLWRAYSREGQLMKEGKYNAGKEDGLWTYYEYENGRKMVSMELAVESGMIAEGVSRVYKNGQTFGEGQLKRVPAKALFQMYKDGKQTEVVDAQNQPDDDPASKTTSKWTGKWLPAVPNGIFVEFYPGTRAKKTEANYMIGKLMGKYKEFYQNGKVKAEGENLAGKKNGVWTFYNADGSIDDEISGQYMSDKLFVKRKK
jgi:antitoxin component YwqK of YwqJK toxin-antitoxin module